jgi:hypothetical protein
MRSRCKVNESLVVGDEVTVTVVAVKAGSGSSLSRPDEELPAQVEYGRHDWEAE